MRATHYSIADPVLRRLAQRLQGIAAALGQLVEEEEAVMGEATSTGWGMLPQKIQNLVGSANDACWGELVVDHYTYTATVPPLKRI